MNPIIFVDIDGPLSWGTWMEGKVKIETFRNSQRDIEIPYKWVSEDCEALSKIIENTNADIVVSSDWKKFYTISDLRCIFQYYGIEKNNIIDITTHFNPMRKLSSPPEWDRACEIKSWVRTFKPKKWIAIDDMPLGINFQRLSIPKWRHVQVDGDFGVGGRLRNKIDECVKKLQK